MIHSPYTKMNNFSLILSLLFFWILISCPGYGKNLEPSDGKLKVLYNHLDPFSISQHLAFYELYSHRNLGQQALKDAWNLLEGQQTNHQFSRSSNIPLSPSSLSILVSLVNKPIDQEMCLTDEEAKRTLVKLSSRLKHFHLKGHDVWSEREVLALPLNEIDLARGIFLSQFGSDRAKIESYEALIDLMALQIQAHLPNDASPEEKIIAINTFIFEEMGFRFPPHSLYAKDIDLYTFLPSVLDSRRGVCLGVSILYLCIAQRLALPLEMITPPGHIYVRYSQGGKEINIETTARGIHLDSKDYLSINYRAHYKRTIKEIIGMAHFNQASVFWQNRNFEKALEAYQKAEPYMPSDPLLKEFMGYLLILTGSKEKGEMLVREIKNVIPDCMISRNTMAEDYLNGDVDALGIAAIFTKVDEDRQSLLSKKQILEDTLKRFPRFRAGIVTLAVTWLQLHRMGEALDLLSHLPALDGSDPEVHYYLAVLNAQRRDYPKAWFHLQQTEMLTAARQHYPKVLKELRRELLNLCPEY